MSWGSIGRCSDVGPVRGDEDTLTRAVVTLAHRYGEVRVSEDHGTPVPCGMGCEPQACRADLAKRRTEGSEAATEEGLDVADRQVVCAARP